MSLRLPDDHVRSPWQRGMIEGVVQADPRQYAYVAYRLPHGYTWFAGPQARAGVKPDCVGCPGQSYPAKGRWEVAAVTHAGYAALHYAELEWWQDYDNHVAPLQAAWAANNFPNVLPQFLPPLPANIHLAGVKFAHRMVARREGREEELPADFDVRENVEADYPYWDQ